VKVQLLVHALGLSLEGFKSMMEMQFADFVTVGFNQIVNNLAKIITAGDRMPM
jgi:2-oxoisovalerate dehydrogenase E1 component